MVLEADGGTDRYTLKHKEDKRTLERVLGHDHPDTLESMHGQANWYADRGRYAEAESLLLETHEIKKRVLGHDHPDTLWSMGSLAILYERQGRYDEAGG